MKDTADKHQIKIARDSFNKNSCFGARILGMTHQEAYEILKAKTRDNPSPCPDCMKEKNNAS